MNATKNIIDILKACGCSPTVTTDERGNDRIKINAPAAETERDAETPTEDDEIIPLF